MHALFDALKQYQRDEHLSDGKLAAILNIDRATLSYIKSGKRIPGAKVLKAISRELPNLQPLVIDFMANGDNGND